MSLQEQLLSNLGVTHYTKRHLKIITDFLMNEKTDCKELLNQLGTWNEDDLVIAERWLYDVYNSSPLSKFLPPKN